MNTLLLDQTTWDLCLDAQGNIAMAADPYSVAQDVASALRLFLGEAWYDTTQGLPYFALVLGHAPALGVLKSLFESAALTVPEVATAQAFITGMANRQLTGQVQVTLTTGATLAIGIGAPGGGVVLIDEQGNPLLDEAGQAI